jgi:hypothetical protein
MVPWTYVTTNLHLMHDGSSDDNAAVGVPDRIPPLRNRNAVLKRVHMPVDDVVFGANEDTRRAVKPIRGRDLSTRNLDEKIGATVCRLAPFAYNMVQTEVQLIICQHLRANVQRLSKELARGDDEPS